MRRLLARWRYARLQRRLALPRLLHAFADAYPDAVFVEIGSNDGEQHDHLRPHILARNWSGVMVEPVPYVFSRLQANYADLDRVALENAAIAERDGELPFFHLRDADPEERSALPDWYDGVGSFSREAILSHAPQMPDIEERIVCREVPALSFASLCDRHGIAGPDLILIDTEGHDWEIIRSVDLNAHRPRLLVFEHFHLSREDRATCRDHLRAAGFLVKEEGFDTMALWPLSDDLTKTFERLRPAVGGLAKYEEAV